MMQTQSAFGGTRNPGMFPLSTTRRRSTGCLRPAEPVVAPACHSTAKKAAELFATPYRASAQGVLFFAARIAVGLLSSAFPVLLTRSGIGFVGTLLISFLTLAAIIGAIWAPETRGKTLQQIEAERYAA